jgi:hypothetical protein
VAPGRAGETYDRSCNDATKGAAAATLVPELRINGCGLHDDIAWNVVLVDGPEVLTDGRGVVERGRVHCSGLIRAGGIRRAGGSDYGSL